jgi:hypothetical protein
MSRLKPLVPWVKVEDLANGGNQKVLDALRMGVDHREVKNLVRHLRGLDLRRIDLEHLKRILLPLTNGYLLGSMATNIDEPIYRAVRWSDKPTNRTQLSYPPSSVVPQGRVNSPGNSMFYGSAGCHSTILELAPDLGDRLAISKWRTKTNLHLICVGYTEQAFRDKGGMSRFAELPWVKQYAEDPLSKRKGNDFVHEYLAREFTKRVPANEVWRYKISATYAESVLGARSFGIQGSPAIELAGIVYPSTPNEANADNVALKPYIVDNYLEFVSVQYIEISQKAPGPTYSMRGLDFADSLSASGEIEWQNSFPPMLIAGTDHSGRFGEDG